MNAALYLLGSVKVGRPSVGLASVRISFWVELVILHSRGDGQTLALALTALPECSLCDQSYGRPIYYGILQLQYEYGGTTIAHF